MKGIKSRINKNDRCVSLIRSKGSPKVLPMRQRAEVVNRALAERLETVLPKAMREAGIDMWLVICQEDNLDPVYESMIPMDTWRARVYYGAVRGGPCAGVGRQLFEVCVRGGRGVHGVRVPADGGKAERVFPSLDPRARNIFFCECVSALIQTLC